jgi:type I restriction-modification system DNA methylase subunit
VSNWRIRHTDFPLPVDSGSAGDLFDRDEVLKWLRDHGRAHYETARDEELALWDISQLHRMSGLDLDASVLLLAQLAYFSTVASDVDRASATRFWSKIRKGDEVLQAWNSAVASLSKMRPELERVLALPRGIQPKHLMTAAETFDPARGADRDWGAAITQLLRDYQEGLKARGSYSATPSSITKLALELMAPISGSVYDPASGLAMVLTQAWRARKNDDVRLFGQEIGEDSWRLGYLQLAINGAKFILENGDSLRADRFPALRADRAIVDPPWGQRIDVVGFAGDERWSFGVPRSSSEWLWAQQLLFHLAHDGIAVMTTTLGALSRIGTESSVRQRIAEAGVLDVVIELPPGLLLGSSMPLALLVFARNRIGRQDHTLFINARQLGVTRRGKPRELSNDDNQRISATVAAWRDGSFTDEPLFASAASLELMADMHFDLAPSRYVGYEAEQITVIDGEPIEERLDRLRTEMEEVVAAVGPLVESVRAGTGTFVRNEDEPWPMARLGDLLVTAPRTGVRQDAERQGAVTVPFIATRLVSAGPGHLDVIPEETSRRVAKDRLATRGDLLLVSRGIEPNGQIRCAVVRFDSEVAYAESLMRLRPDQTRVDPDFLRLYLSSRHGRAPLAAVTTGTVIPNLRPDALVEIKVPLPPLAEQRRIAAVLTDVEGGVEGLTRALGNATAVLDTIREGVAGGMFVPSNRESKAIP